MVLVGRAVVGLVGQWFRAAFRRTGDGPVAGGQVWKWATTKYESVTWKLIGGRKPRANTGRRRRADAGGGADGLPTVGDGMSLASTALGASPRLVGLPTIGNGCR